MNSWKKKHILRLCMGILCTVTIVSANTSVYAAPGAGELEGKTSRLQGDLSSMNSELASLCKELDEVSSEIESMAAEVEQTKLQLAAAKLNEDAQYDAMKDRIKFIYEGGSLSLLTVLFSSKNMSDFLNGAEYVAAINEYDRNMLDELHAVRADVEEKQTNLENKQDELTTLAEELTEKKDTLTARISSTSGQLSDYSAQLERARAAEAAAAVAKNNEVSGSLSGSANNQANNNTGATNSGGAADTNTNTGGPVNGGSSIPANTSDVALLAAVLECEAGASYDGMLAVGTIVMNRVASPSFPNSIPDVIYQKNQFYAPGNEVLNGVLARGPSASACSAAQAVIGGTRHSAVLNCYFFYSAAYAAQMGVTGVNVAGNVFFEHY